MKSIISLVIVFFLAGFRLTMAENIAAERIEPAPVIDGKLNEAGWQKARYAEKYTMLKTINKTMPPTYATILFDNENLYVGIICKTTNSATLKAVKRKKNEGDVFQAEEIEVMIDPCTGGDKYLQVAVDPAGSRFDAWRSHKGAVSDTSWEGDWQAATDIGEREWSCELKFPFVLLRGKEGVSAPWRINICRRTLDPPGYASLAGDDSFNIPDKFAFLNGITKIPSVSQIPVFRVLNPSVEINLRNGKMYCGIRAMVTNITAVAGTAAMYLEEERENNKRIRVASAKTELREFEGKEVVLDSPVELVPVNGSRNLWQTGKPLMLVAADSDAKLAYSKQSFWPFVKPIQLSVVDWLKPELEIRSGFSKEGKGSKDGKITITIENTEGINKPLVSREYQLAGGSVTADFHADKLPASRLLARVCVKDAAGKTICTNELIFEHLSKEPERLNNLVCRLDKGKFKIEKSETKELVFQNPRDGWILLKLAVALHGDGVITVGKDGAEWLKISVGGDVENMRWLPSGTHRLSVAATSDGKIDYEIRSVPELIFCAYHYSPFDRTQGRIKFGPYDGEYLKNNRLLRNINGMVIGMAAKGFAEEWVRGGGRCFDTAIPPGAWGPDKKDVIIPEHVFKVWSENSSLTNALNSGFFIDEFNDEDDLSDKMMGWLAGIRLMFADKRFEDKMIYPYLTYPEVSGKFIDGCCDAGARPCYEWYPYERPTEKETVIVFEAFRDRMAHLERKIPGLMKRSLFALASMSMIGSESCDTCPEVDYKVFLDLQYGMIANDPLFKDFGGIQLYSSGYTDDEITRWCFALFRHYGIEGRRDRLSEQYGFKYELKHIMNADFDKGLEGWETKAAAEGTIAVKEIKEYGGKTQGRWQTIDVGNHVLWMKRNAKGPNVAAQVVKGLEAGRLYSLKMLYGDFGDLMAGKSVATNYALKVNLENVEIIPSKSFLGLLASFVKDYYFNYHWTVFRAKGTEARLVISDWADENNPGGPEGQELICNFIQVQPFFAKEPNSR